MKINQLNISMFLVISCFIALSACKKKDDEVPMNIEYSNGVFVVNEGPYSNGSGSISFIDVTTNSVYNNIFENKNGFPMGSIAQSMNVIGGKGYLVINNANKVEIVDPKSFASIGTISGLANPRYITAVGATKAYISQWGSDGVSGSIKVVDLNTNTITSTIAVGSGAENMLLIGNSMYVACSGGYASDSSVYVINTTTDVVSDIIKVGANPNDLVSLDNQSLFVLCAGRWKSDYSELEAYGSLVKINVSDNSFSKLFELSDMYAQPGSLTGHNGYLYFNFNGDVYKQSATSSTLDNTKIIHRDFYGLGVDPISNKIYGADAGNFSQAGKVLRYDLSGNVIDSFTVAVAPNGFYFNTK
jgi:YVTN family beta-propeller protein